MYRMFDDNLDLQKGPLKYQNIHIFFWASKVRLNLIQVI